MRVSGRLFLCGIGGLLVMSSFLFIAHGNVHSEADKSDDEASSYGNTPAINKEHIQDFCPVGQSSEGKECFDKVNIRQQKTEEHSQQQPTCIPVFKRFLAKLLREIEKLGLPTSVTAEKHYDAEVKLSRQMVSEIRKIVNDESSWKTGALDDALSQILINIKLHDYEASKGLFEGTFGVEFGTVITVSGMAMLFVLIICTEMWSVVSWFVQFRGVFAVCFVISLAWNWVCLYKIAFADHQADMVKMEPVSKKCTGVNKIDWIDNLKEWYRTTWTLQDDPCKKYYQLLIVNPILLVPPTKAITMTIVSFITDPLKQLGQGISEFFRALLKDLPVTLQLPVFISFVLFILVFFYSTGQAAIHYAVLGPLQGRRQDPPPGIAQQPAAPQLQEPEEHREEEQDLLVRGNANRAAQPRH
ncbi:chloride channel CLIC-like protein 1 [Clarias gariepinus]|uniref:chloride channel CLIC-like protein 1 n=1 Tax=Clarias gariepinus TaxID=13013 RepID=UPI00234C1580|nr:chloride channel CLIC-like protein 1 [Clarias gariepinus]